jgi:hypothetical protein
MSGKRIPMVGHPPGYILMRGRSGIAQMWREIDGSHGCGTKLQTQLFPRQWRPSHQSIISVCLKQWVSGPGQWVTVPEQWVRCQARGDHIYKSCLWNTTFIFVKITGMKSKSHSHYSQDLIYFLGCSYWVVRFEGRISKSSDHTFQFRQVGPSFWHDKAHVE